MTRRPALSIALFLLVVVLVVSLAGVALVQTEPPPPESDGSDALLLMQFAVDSVAPLAVLASGALGYSIGRVR